MSLKAEFRRFGKACNTNQQCADQWWLLNATNQTSDLVAFKTEGTLLVQQPELYDAIKRQALGETP
jgi:hypothetical protein